MTLDDPLNSIDIDGKNNLLNRFFTKIYGCVFWSEPWNVCLRSLCLFDCNVNNNQIYYSFCQPLETGDAYCPHDFDYCYYSRDHIDHCFFAYTVFIIKMILNIIYCVLYAVFLIIAIVIFLVILVPACICLILFSIKKSLCHFMHPSNPNNNYAIVSTGEGVFQIQTI